MTASQCDRVFEVLKDHRPHSIEEIHERAGTMRLNSRIADLRKRGHNIVCTRERTHFDEKRRPQHTYFYVLVRPLDSEQEPNGAAPGVASPRLPVDAAPALSGTAVSSCSGSSGSAGLTANPAHGDAEPLQLSLLPPARPRERWAA